MVPTAASELRWTNVTVAVDEAVLRGTVARATAELLPAAVAALGALGARMAAGAVAPAGGDHGACLLGASRPRGLSRPAPAVLGGRGKVQAAASSSSCARSSCDAARPRRLAHRPSWSVKERPDGRPPSARHCCADPVAGSAPAPNVARLCACVDDDAHSRRVAASSGIRSPVQARVPVHAVVYGVVVTGLTVLNALLIAFTDADFPWAVFPLRGVRRLTLHYSYGFRRAEEEAQARQRVERQEGERRSSCSSRCWARLSRLRALRKTPNRMPIFLGSSGRHFA